MYQIICDGIVIATVDDYMYIRLSKNGSYVPCDETIAEGICARVPQQIEITQQDDAGQTVSEVTNYSMNTVFRLKENAMRKTEPLCTIIKLEDE